MASKKAFYRTIWAPLEGSKFRVNSPDTITGKYKDRWEAKQTGLMTIDLDTDPAMAESASIYLELWGGHPGVANKRFTLNGQAEYKLPEVGSQQRNCTYWYPDIPLKLEHLKQGENLFQFTCDKGTTFWGHYLIREAALRLKIRPDETCLQTTGVGEFPAKVLATHPGDREEILLSLSFPAASAEKIDSVEYTGRYVGYDENGDGQAADWHGFTKDRRPVGIIGVSREPPFRLRWDTSMLPDQQTVAVRATVNLKGPREISYHTPPASIALGSRLATVTMHRARGMPRPFTSRVGRRKACWIDLPYHPTAIQQAELHTVVWDGGAGDAKDYFTLNGHPLKVAGRGRHDLIYRVTPIDPDILTSGQNRIVLYSTTEHHGIEIVLPGPALIVRTAPSDPSAH